MEAIFKVDFYIYKKQLLFDIGDKSFMYNIFLKTKLYKKYFNRIWNNKYL